MLSSSSFVVFAGYRDKTTSSSKSEVKTTKEPAAEKKKAEKEGECYINYTQLRGERDNRGSLLLNISFNFVVLMMLI